MRRIVSTILTVALFTSCTPEAGSGTDRREDEPACTPKLSSDGSEVAGNCDIDLVINGKPRARTHVAYKVGVNQGGSALMTGNADFPAYDDDPQGGSLYVELDEKNGYTLDARGDGRVNVRPHPIDPNNPEASAEKLVVEILNKDGVVRSDVIKCPRMVEFAAYVQDHGLPPNDSESSCDTPNFETGCFPCAEFSALLNGENGLALRADIRARAGVLHAITSDAAGPNQDPITAVLVVLGAIVAGAVGVAACGYDKGPPGTQGGCTWKF